MELRRETVYLKDANGNPYTQVDHWHDRWIIDEDGNETDEAVSVLVFHARRNPADEEISLEEYDALMADHLKAIEDHKAAVEDSRKKRAESHQRALKAGVKKLKESGLTKGQAEAVLKAMTSEEFVDLAEDEG